LEKTGSASWRTLYLYNIAMSKPSPEIPLPSSIDPSTQETRLYSRRRVQNGLTATVGGFFLFLLGARPAIFGMDISPVVGFVQITVFTIGLTIMCAGGYATLTGLWKNRTLSIVADIGIRLIATGYVISFFCGLADYFGFTRQHYPSTPNFGPLQSGGYLVGQIIISIGFIMLLPFNSRPNKAS
jgi:hypothetical protein